jgi:FAD/FMN-containing dehydrogenase
MALPVLGRDEAGFETARVDRIFNRRLTDRQPAAVVRPTTEAEVVEAVRLARHHGWQVAVRSGGHSWAQWSVRSDALVIDLGGLTDVSYDESSGIASAGPAVKGGAELGPFLESRGRFFPGGHCPTVGIGGFLLQGGQGWNARGLGWAAEYVEAVDVVTASGELLRADAQQNADLYWAARGAGPGFPGVVTRFHPRTLPRPEHVAQTVHAYSLDDFDEVMTWLHESHDTVAETVEIVALTKTDPTIAAEPILLVTGVALVSSPAEASEALAPFRLSPALDRALLVLDAVPTTLDEQRKRQLADNPNGHQDVHDLVLDGAAPRASRHGVLAPVGDLPRVVRRVGVTRGRRTLHRVDRAGHGRPRAGHRRPVPRRQRPVAARGAVRVRRRLGAPGGGPGGARP